eukprot:gene21642-28650_t
MDLSEFDFSCFDCDNNGNLFAINKANGKIAVVSIHESVMAAKQKEETAGKESDADHFNLSLKTAKIRRGIETTPAVKFDVQSMGVSSSGRYLHLSGTSVSDVTWHPHSEHHLAVLTSDNRWRLYSMDDLTQAEQSFHLCTPALPDATASRDQGHCPRTPSQFGLRSASSGGKQITAFEFGPSVLWGRFTVNFIAASGAIYALCPVAPFGMLVPCLDLQQIMQSSAASGSHGTTEAWLELAFGASISEDIDAKEHWRVLPHIHEEASPALQSLLDPSSESILEPHVVSSSLQAVAMYSAHKVMYPDLPDQFATAHATNPMMEKLHGEAYATWRANNPPAVTSAVVSALSNGTLYVHVMQEMPAPMWTGAPQQCITDTQGSIKAVRSECEVVVPPLQKRGGGWLTLLDAIEIQLTSQHAPDPNSDDECDMGPASRPGLERIKLLGSDEYHHQLQCFWACHSSGCWKIDLAWLPRLSKTTNLSGSVTLPPPIVYEQLRVPMGGAGGSALAAALSWATTLQDISYGGSPLVCQGNSLHYMGRRSQAKSTASRTPPADASASDARQQVIDANIQSLKATASHAPSAGASGSASNARQQSLYGDLLREPMPISLYGDLLQEPVPIVFPKPRGPCGAQNPEGVAHLHDCINLMRQAHIENIHRAHHDLSQRCKQLETEGSSHVKALDELKALADKVASRQADMMDRLNATQDLQRNLTDRADLLTSMHWSLPRPVSDSEKDFSIQLQQMSDQQAAMAATWSTLQRRAKSVREQSEAREKQQAQGTGVGLVSRPLSSPMVAPPTDGSMPPAQLAKVHASVIEQYRMIRACKADVAQAAEDIKRWKRA